MAWTSILAVYALFWVMSAFILLPFGVKTADEAGVAKVPGQADSAPVDFKPGKIAKRATLLSIALTTLWILNWEYQWISVDMIDIFQRPDHLKR